MANAKQISLLLLNLAFFVINANWAIEHKELLRNILSRRIKELPMVLVTLGCFISVIATSIYLQLQILFFAFKIYRKLFNESFFVEFGKIELLVSILIYLLAALTQILKYDLKINAWTIAYALAKSINIPLLKGIKVWLQNQIEDDDTVFAITVIAVMYLLPPTGFITAYLLLATLFLGHKSQR
jgi:hypothetical protein